MPSRLTWMLVCCSKASRSGNSLLAWPGWGSITENSILAMYQLCFHGKNIRAEFDTRTKASDISQNDIQALRQWVEMFVQERIQVLVRVGKQLRPDIWYFNHQFILHGAPQADRGKTAAG